jgi:tetratricopeptide (TPR) repeat protein
VNVLQTLEAMMRFSVDDLAESAPEAVTAFWALGAFAPKPATFALAAARAVTGADEEALALLAERNLVEGGAGDWLAVHQVVHDVMGTGTPEKATAAHARYYTQAMMAADDEQRYYEMLPTLPQLRFAFAWAIEKNLDLALDIAISSANLQKQFNLVHEGGDWSERLLEAARNRDVASETLARALGHRANLLSAMATLPGEERGERLLEALAAYDDALQYYRPEVVPLDYAKTQNNRANLLSEIATLPGEDRRKRLLEALAAYDDALQYRRSEVAPLDYATTQNNRASVLNAIATLPGEERGKRLLEALAAYDDALQYRRPEVAPLDYAATQNSRGVVLSDIATLPGEERGKRLLEALAAYDDALQYYRPEVVPLDYAMTQNNRGLVLSEITTLPGEGCGKRLLEVLRIAAVKWTQLLRR